MPTGKPADLLFRTARSILRNDDDDAEDVLQAQDAYLHAWRSLAGFWAEAWLSINRTDAGPA